MVFRTTKNMSSCFRFELAIPRSFFSGVIYEYKCPSYNSRYIGPPYRYWQTILGEQLHMSALTGKPLKVEVSPSKKIIFVCFNEIPLKMIHLKSPFHSQDIFIFDLTF